MKKTSIGLLALTLSLVLAGCGSNDTKKTTKKKSDYKSRVAMEIEDFTEEQDVYTAQQRAFLEYTGDYATLTASELKTMGMPSTAENSKPVPVTFKWYYEEPEEVTGYEIHLSEDEDMKTYRTVKVGKQAAAEIKTAEVYNLHVGTEYYYTIQANYSDGFADFTDANHNGKADPHYVAIKAGPIRNYYVEGLTNFRDLGGKALSRGGTLAFNKIYRSSAFLSTQSPRVAITDAGKEYVKDELGIIAEIDLWGNANDKTIIPVEKASDGGSQIKYYDCRMNYENSKDILHRNVETFKRCFEILGKEENYPMDFHCRIGTDRTGALACLIEALLGVSKKDILQDYLFSNFGYIQSGSASPRTVGQTNEDGMGKYFDFLQSYKGNTLADKTYNWLRTIGVSASALDTVIRVLRDGGDEHVPTNAVTDATLTSSVAKTVNSTKDLRQPLEYYTLAQNNTISASLNIKEAGTYCIFVTLTSKATSSTLSSEIGLQFVGETSQPNINATSMSTSSLGIATDNDFWVEAELITNMNMSAKTYNIQLTALNNALGIANLTAIKVG